MELLLPCFLHFVLVKCHVASATFLQTPPWTPTLQFPFRSFFFVVIYWGFLNNVHNSSPHQINILLSRCLQIQKWTSWSEIPTSPSEHISAWNMATNYWPIRQQLAQNSVRNSSTCGWCWKGKQNDASSSRDDISEFILTVLKLPIHISQL